MKLTEFINEAINIGCKDAYIDAQANGKRYQQKDVELVYTVYCGECKKHTEEFANPFDALQDFRAMHANKGIQEDMVIEEKPAFLRKIMD